MPAAESVSTSLSLLTCANVCRDNMHANTLCGAQCFYHRPVEVILGRAWRFVCKITPKMCAQILIKLFG